MQTLASVLLVIVSLALIVVVLLQSGKSSGLGAISGGAEQLMGKQKARGIDAVLNKATIVLGILFFVLTLTVAYFL